MSISATAEQTNAEKGNAEKGNAEKGNAQQPTTVLKRIQNGTAYMYEASKQKEFLEW